MADEAKRVQVPMSRKVRDMLRDWAAELSKDRDEEIGTGTVAGELLEKVMANPDLVHRLLFEDANAEAEPIAKKARARAVARGRPRSTR